MKQDVAQGSQWMIQAPVAERGNPAKQSWHPPGRDGMESVEEGRKFLGKRSVQSGIDSDKF